ncbi:hypothetical protein [Sphaerospermopsis sp. LEGE 08334]|uniref:hypothetical protein n=1 Tax=Sphaerospermopsis sp. LEGE 08334 TaxID=1828651 RepID=UPI0018809B7E|nr:hypothetical protein [Sphaerospermopsis sp. LEGE 08334]MBE9055671.1 hypothetical protein [Sphaerospermopsis sp. LEGE 08334]
MRPQISTHNTSVQNYEQLVKPKKKRWRKAPAIGDRKNPVNPLILDILIQTKIYFAQRRKGAKSQRRYPVNP